MVGESVASVDSILTSRSPNRVLAGQSALVTGASSGLGRRFACVLAAAGAKVVVVARRRDRLDDVVAEIKAAGGLAEAITLDLANVNAFAAVVDAAERAVGQLTILVNNAGIPCVGNFIDQSLETIESVLNINVKAPLLLSKEFARRLIARGAPGRVVNISSMSSVVYTGEVPCAVYAVTKSAINRMTEVLAVEWARHNINVNAIAPGLFRTEMLQAATPAQLLGVTSSMPRGRIGEAHQLDSTLLYLVAPNSEFVTGVCIKVDDGQISR
jgi:NAD(P)-dependent dehydrogenase (short-subunit alcohol dehydrogenase family)